MKSKEFIDLCESYEVDPDNVPEITSFEAACKVTGDDPESLPDVSRCATRHQKRMISDYKLSIIADALRGGKNVDYTNGSEWKHFPVFTVEADNERPSGFGLSFDCYDDWLAFSFVGVRLCFQNEDVAIFFGKHFLSLHVDHQLLT
jgi:hypothetical protein